MLLQRLVLRHFRSYGEVCVDLGAGLNVFVGDNAQGKTSLLEAVFLCVSGRSFRSQKLRDLIQHGADFFAVETTFQKLGVSQRLLYSMSVQGKNVSLNGTPFRSLAQLLGVIPGVLMAPQDDALVKGSPRTRRHYLDLQLVQVDPFYLQQLVRYQKAMKQRNHLLRHRDMQTIDLWEGEMARAASYIVAQRHCATVDLSQRASVRYASFVEGDEPLTMRYKTAAPSSEDSTAIEEYYLRKYREGREREMAQKHSLFGPHTEDVSLEISGKEGRHFASEGQQRCIVAAMRLAEWERLHQLSELHPLLVVDDFALGMDASRRKRLMDQLSRLGQVFLSSAQDPAELGLPKEAALFQISKGSCQRLASHQSQSDQKGSP